MKKIILIIAGFVISVSIVYSQGNDTSAATFKVKKATDIVTDTLQSPFNVRKQDSVMPCVNIKDSVKINPMKIFLSSKGEIDSVRVIFSNKLTYYDLMKIKDRLRMIGMGIDIDYREYKFNDECGLIYIDFTAEYNVGTLDNPCVGSLQHASDLTDRLGVILQINTKKPGRGLIMNVGQIIK